MPSSLTTAPAGTLAAPLAAPVAAAPRGLPMPPIPQAWPLPRLAALLVALPVFLQAPWVRLAPFSAALFTAPLLSLALLLALQPGGRWRRAAGPAAGQG